MGRKTGLILIATVCSLTFMTGCSSKENALEPAPGSKPAIESETIAEGEAPGDAKAEEVIELKVASVVSQSAKDAAEEFTKQVLDETGGRIKVTFFHDNQLGDDKSVVEATQMGDIDMAISPITPLASFYNDFYLFDAPFVFFNYEDAYSVLDGEIGQAMLKDLEKYQLKAFGFGENGFRYLTNSKVPVKTPSDLKGLKIRVMENEVQLATWKAFGANPTPMSFNELYTALQQKTVDGEENSLGIIDSSQFMTVQKYLSLAQHTYVPFVFCMNLNKFNSLSAEDQKIIENAAKVWVTKQREYSQKYDKEILDKIRNTEGVEVIDITDEEKQQWMDLVIEAEIYGMIKEKMTHPEYLDQVLHQ